MSKKEIVVTKCSISPYDFDGTLANAKEYIDKLITLHGSDAHLDVSEEWDGDRYRTYMSIKVTRLETDDEHIQRLKREELTEARNRERELRMLSYLSEKYKGIV